LRVRHSNDHIFSVIPPCKGHARKNEGSNERFKANLNFVPSTGGGILICTEDIVCTVRSSTVLIYTKTQFVENFSSRGPETFFSILSLVLCLVLWVIYTSETTAVPGRRPQPGRAALIHTAKRQSLVDISKCIMQHHDILAHMDASSQLPSLMYLVPVIITLSALIDTSLGETSSLHLSSHVSLNY